LTWLLLYPEYQDSEKVQALQDVIDWALNNGDQYAQELGYIPLPEDVKQRVVETVQQKVIANK
jgi:phosphate transport system substrate-binding protein